MSLMRVREPLDPELCRISKVLADRWVDERWPQRRTRHQGRWQRLRSSQLVRVHLLALIKALGSFNRVCAELRHNNDFRRFCRLAPSDAPPAPACLAKFRARFNKQAWRDLHAMVLEALARVFAPSPLGLILIDSSDLPAAVRTTWKKKTILLCESAWRA